MTPMPSPDEQRRGVELLVRLLAEHQGCDVQVWYEWDGARLKLCHDVTATAEWAVMPSGHVLPEGDLRPHVESGACWCRPEHDDEYGVFVHHSLDLRETYDDGARKPH